MYWTARCNRDPWLAPEGASCQRLGAFIPDDLRQAVPDLQTVSFPKTKDVVSPGDRQRLYAEYLRVNSPVATNVNPLVRAPVPTDDMFTILKPSENDRVVQGQLIVTARQPKLGMTPVTELEFRWLDAPPNQPYVNKFAVDTPKLLQGYPVAQAVTRGNAGRWEVRARASGKPVPGPWSFPVQFQLFLSQPTQSQKQAPQAMQQTPLPSSSVTQAPSQGNGASSLFIRPRGVEEPEKKETDEMSTKPGRKP